MKKEFRADISCCASVFFALVILYAYTLYARTVNADAFLNLAYDKEGCAPVGRSQADVRSCFGALGYTGEYHPLGDHIFPPTVSLSIPPAYYWLEIRYDKTGRIEWCNLCAQPNMMPM